MRQHLQISRESLVVTRAIQLEAWSSGVVKVEQHHVDLRERFCTIKVDNPLEVHCLLTSIYSLAERPSPGRD